MRIYNVSSEGIFGRLHEYGAFHNIKSSIGNRKCAESIHAWLWQHRHSPYGIATLNR